MSLGFRENSDVKHGLSDNREVDNILVLELGILTFNGPLSIHNSINFLGTPRHVRCI